MVLANLDLIDIFYLVWTQKVLWDLSWAVEGPLRWPEGAKTEISQKSEFFKQKFWMPLTKLIFHAKGSSYPSKDLSFHADFKTGATFEIMSNFEHVMGDFRKIPTFPFLPISPVFSDGFSKNWTQMKGLILGFNISKNCGRVFCLKKVIWVFVFVKFTSFNWNFDSIKLISKKHES